MACLMSAYQKSRDLGLSVFKTLKSSVNWFFKLGFHLKGNVIDVKVISRILFGIVYSVVYPLMDLITDILVATLLYVVENFAAKYSSAVATSNKAIDQAFEIPLKMLSNHYLSLAAILVLVNPIISTFVSNIGKVMEEWRQSKNLWGFRKLVTELPVITGICHIPFMIKTLVSLRQLELKLEKEKDKQSDLARLLRKNMKKSNLKVLRWKVDCTITEFFYESAPSLIFLTLFFATFGALPMAIVYSLLTSYLTSFVTSGKLYLAHDNSIPPILSHTILVALPVGFITLVKLLSSAVIIQVIALLLNINAQLIFIICYFFHCTILVSPF